MKRLVPKFRRSRLAALIVCAAFAGVPLAAHARKVAAPAAAGQQVPFPNVLRDAMGGMWDVQQDGTIGDGGNDLYDGGGRLSVTAGAGGMAQYASGQATATFDAARNELVLAAAQMGGLRVSRRITVNAKDGWCRWVEMLENPSATAIKASVAVNFNLGSGVQASQQIVDDKKTKKPFALAVSDGPHFLAMIGGGRGSKLLPRFQANQGADDVGLFYDLDVPAKGTAAVVHFQVSRRSMADALAFAEGMKEKDLLADLPPDVAKAVVNFYRAGGTGGGQSLGDLELLRGGALDVVEIRGGDQLRGTITQPTFTLDTSTGPLELPADKVIAMLTVGSLRPTQLLVTSEGEVFGGALRGDAIKLQLGSGQVTAIPISSVTRLGFRQRAGEPAEWKFDKPILFLRDGQRIGVNAPAEPIPVSSVYGTLQLKPEQIAAIRFHGEDQPVHQVRLVDGSRFAAVVARDALDLTPRSAGGGQPVKYPSGAIARLQLAVAPEEPDAEAPTLTLGNGDLLVGALAGELSLETAFDTLQIDAAQVRSLRHVGGAKEGERDAAAGSPAEVRVTLWDDATLSGRLKADGLDLRLKSGLSMRVPVALVEQYEQPNPQPPKEMEARIRAVAAELGSADWKQRDRAADQLRRVGPAAASVLKAVRSEQSPEGQKGIDALLKEMEGEKQPAKAKPAGAGNEAGGPPPGFDLQLVPE